jgi:hypothetical protein
VVGVASVVFDKSVLVHHHVDYVVVVFLGVDKTNSFDEACYYYYSDDEQRYSIDVLDDHDTFPVVPILLHVIVAFSIPWCK